MDWKQLLASTTRSVDEELPFGQKIQTHHSHGAYGLSSRDALVSYIRKSSNRVPTCRPGTSWKCPSSLNTAKPCCNALAAIHMSLVGMGRPRRLSARYTIAYCTAVSASMTSWCTR